jgi:hypothetical protein
MLVCLRMSCLSFFVFLRVTSWMKKLLHALVNEIVNGVAEKLKAQSLFG